MELVLLGLVTSINFIVILKKWRLGRYFDSFIDGSILSFISILFGNTFSGFVVGNIASAFISLWLYFHPITFHVMNPFSSHEDDEDED